MQKLSLILGDLNPAVDENEAAIDYLTHLITKKKTYDEKNQGGCILI